MNSSAISNINKKGEWFIEPAFVNATSFSEGYAVVEIRADECEAIEINTYRFECKINGKNISVLIEAEDFNFTYYPIYFIIDSQGNVVLIPPRLKITECEGFHEGLAVFHETYNYGYIDTTGKIAIEANYIEAKPFTNGVALVVPEYSGDYDEEYVVGTRGKWIMINRKGTPICLTEKYYKIEY